MAEIKVRSLFSSTHLEAGSSGTSDVVNMKDAGVSGKVSLTTQIAAGTSGTAGTTVFTYLGASTEDGTFVTPSGAAAIGTAGTANLNDIIEFTPVVIPYIKIVATQTGEGNDGDDSNVTALLNIG